MMNDEEAPEYPEDDADIEILRKLHDLLREAGVSGLQGVGPVENDRVTITFSKEGATFAKLPDMLEVTRADGARVRLKTDIRVEDTQARLFAGLSPPFTHSGPLMGGEGVWNDTASQWGTISFIVPTASGITVEGHPCAGMAVTCNHVLNVNGTKDASTVPHAQAMTMHWYIKPPVGQTWLDLAGADMRTAAFKPLEVRGLGKITGVRRSRKGDRVSKYGATTGLTSALDGGWGLRVLNSPSTALYYVKVVAGRFGDVGDSGAPVMDADRNLVGIIVSGTISGRRETYFIQASRTPSLANAKDLSRFVISGL